MRVCDFDGAPSLVCASAHVAQGYSAHSIVQMCQSPLQVQAGSDILKARRARSGTDIASKFAELPSPLQLTKGRKSRDVLIALPAGRRVSSLSDTASFRAEPQRMARRRSTTSATIKCISILCNHPNVCTCQWFEHTRGCTRPEHIKAPSERGSIYERVPGRE